MKNFPYLACALWLSVLLTAQAEVIRLRVATFNASLNRAASGQLRSVLSDPDGKGREFKSDQVRAIAETIQRMRPDVLLINEFDFDDQEPRLVDLFHDKFLAVEQGWAKPITYPYRYTPPVNTGVHSGMDLDGRNGPVSELGKPGYAEDAFGFGQFPGQYGMAVYSKFPIDTAKIRTFQKFLWKDLPGNLLMVEDIGLPGATGAYFAPGVPEKLRLSSKTHADIPILLGGKSFHLLTSHPTPPVFDGPEDRNGRRNHDEIVFWTHYLDGSKALVDDAGKSGGLADKAPFVILGDLNSDPIDGDSRKEGIKKLLAHSAVNSAFIPQSAGGVNASKHLKGVKGFPEHDTSDFMLRVDYVLPSRSGFKVVDGAVFWPTGVDPLVRLVGTCGFANGPSDHRLVWLDLEFDPG